MSTASLSDGAGPGSSISLAPETIRVRNALIEKFTGEPLEDMQSFMANALAHETDELRRLGILAARIYLLRNRVAQIKEFNRDPELPSIPELDTTTLSLSLPDDEPFISDDAPIEEQAQDWSRIQMIEPGEVNGVRFLAGTVIDTKNDDADKLIDSGRAVRIDEDGNIIENHEDDFANADAAKNDGATDDAATDDAIADTDDNISDNADTNSSLTDDDAIAGDTDAADDHDPENTGS
ncbi:hypothetical protein OAT72_00160 [Alphaproteobacteria bacterium]|nr:hypothetical protein [Alphaproteobacteria bacterium]